MENEEIKEAKKKHAGGRPKKVIDLKQVEKLAHIFCTKEEIAGILDVSLSLLDQSKEFMYAYKKGLQNAKKSLRRTQLDLAQKNPALAIWLGKQYLGQREPSVQAEINMNGFSTFIKKMLDETPEVTTKENTKES